VIDSLEKLTWFLGLLVIGVLGLYFAIAGPPSAVPSVAMLSKRVDEKQFFAILPPEQKSTLTQKMTLSHKNKSSRTRFPTDYMLVNELTLDRIGNFTEALRVSHEIRFEIQPAKEEGKSSLMLVDIGAHTPLKPMGFRGRDRIDGIDGIQIDFSDKIAATQLYKTIRDRLADHEPIYFDINRGGADRRIVVHMSTPETDRD